MTGNVRRICWSAWWDPGTIWRMLANPPYIRLTIELARKISMNINFSEGCHVCIQCCEKGFGSGKVHESDL